jgi:hypothetical protein
LNRSETALSRETRVMRKLILPRWGALGREARDTARPPEKRRTHLVRLIRWSPVFVAVTLFAVWVVIYSKWNLRDNPVASCMAIGYLLFICAGSYWMLYDCWHHDKRFTRKMWFFFVPGGFLWYYFEYFRPRHLRRRIHR